MFASTTRRWVLGWVVLTGLVVLALRTLPWGPILDTAKTASPLWLAAAVALNAALLPLAAWEWSTLLPKLRRIPFATMVWIHAVTSTVSNGGPFLAGHATGVHLLATKGGVGHATAVSVKAMEQLTEGLAKLTVVAVTLAMVPLPDPVRVAALALLVGLPVLAGVMVAVAYRGHHFQRWADERTGRAGSALQFGLDVAGGMEAIRRPGAFAGALVLALLQKTTEGAAIWMTAYALDIALPFWVVTMSLAAVGLSTMASVTPANIGVYEGSALLAYRAAGFETDTAVALAIVQHAAYLLPMAGLGWITLALSPPVPTEETEPPR